MKLAKAQGLKVNSKTTVTQLKKMLEANLSEIMSQLKTVVPAESGTKVSATVAPSRSSNDMDSRVYRGEHPITGEPV